MQQSMEWEFLASGSSHTVFVNKSRTFVLKVLIPGEDEPRYAHENLQRSIRIYNEINQHITSPAIEAVNQQLPEDNRIHESAKGMIIPFIAGRQATDAEIKLLVLDIFNRTGRILVDAVTLGNCLIQDDGSCVCVDIDLALKLDKEENEVLSTFVPRASFLSLETWSTLQQQFRQSNLDEKSAQFPFTVAILKALIFIKTVRPDISNASFLNRTTELNLLVTAYEVSIQSNTPQDMVALAQDFLEQEHPAHLSNLKVTCADILTQYFSLEEPSSLENKIACQKLIQGINNASTSEELTHSIGLLQTKIDLQQKFPRLNIALGKCLLASESLNHANNRKSLAHTASFFSKYIYHHSNLVRIVPIHAIDLANISAKILLPMYFLQIFNQHYSQEEIFIPLSIVLLLPVLSEIKNKLLVDISMDVVEKFTRDLLEVGFNPRAEGIGRFTQSFTPDYVEHVTFFINKTYGKLLPSYISLIGFVLAIGFKDQFVGGFAAGSLFLYLGYTYYFLNPRYSNAFKANLVEKQVLYDQLRVSMGRRNLVTFYDRVNEEKSTVTRVLQNILPTTKQKNYYDSQTKIVGLLTGNVTLLVGAAYWVSTYQQSSESITDYILLYYYLYMFSLHMNQLSPLISQLLSSAEKAKGLIQYSMWSENRAQKTYNETLTATGARQEESSSTLSWDLNRVEFSHVWYTNHHSKQVLTDFSVQIEKNSFFAFVGEKSSAYSAIVGLLRRDATPLSGQIMFHPSTSIDELEERALYRLLTIIDSKDEFEEGLSWFDTIKYGNKTASDGAVLEAAVEAGLIETNETATILKTRFIGMEDDTRPIETRRLAIARAILKGGRFLILDNPTAGLEYKDEIAILQTLVYLSNQITTIMLTDKLYLLDSYVHKIFYLQEGRIIEEGTYEDLLRNQKMFYKLLFKQRDDFKNSCSTPNQFYTVMDTRRSMIEKNYQPIGYSLSTKSQHGESVNDDDEAALIGSSYV